MNHSNENKRCTCPSGDGSLRWPCPTHPPEKAEAALMTTYANLMQRVTKKESK